MGRPGCAARRFPDLPVAGQEVADRQGEVVVEPGQVEQGRPAGQRRRHRRYPAPRRGRAFVHYDRAGREVAQPLAARVGEHRGERRNPGQQRHDEAGPLHRDAYEGAGQRVPEPDRAAVVAYHPQAHHQLAVTGHQRPERDGIGVARPRPCRACGSRPQAHELEKAAGGPDTAGEAEGVA